MHPLILLCLIKIGYFSKNVFPFIGKCILLCILLNKGLFWYVYQIY